MVRALILAAALAAQSASAADGVRNVVLVHGAWADGSSWAKVIPLLEKAGLLRPERDREERHKNFDPGEFLLE